MVLKYLNGDPPCTPGTSSCSLPHFIRKKKTKKINRSTSDRKCTVCSSGAYQDLDSRKLDQLKLMDEARYEKIRKVVTTGEGSSQTAKFENKIKKDLIVFKLKQP